MRVRFRRWRVAGWLRIERLAKRLAQLAEARVIRSYDELVDAECAE